jgi:hypothetical protein
VSWLTNHSDQQSSIKDQLDKIEKQGLKLSTESAKELASLRTEIVEAVRDMLNQEMATEDFKPEGRNETSMRSSSSRKGQARTSRYPEEQVKSLQDIQNLLAALQSKTKLMPLEHRILGRLFFESMHQREDSIQDAVAGTFEWILDEEKDNDVCHEFLTDSKRERELRVRSHARQSFLSWLQEGSQVFHISGKPGSGKSTLMKFLCHHPRTRQELEYWAGDKKLVLAYFFFWNSGDKLQMSLKGLYQSLLFETLKQCPELIPKVFPKQWELLENEPEGSAVESNLFRTPRLEEAFQILVTKTCFPLHRFFFCIDGLDEYNGDSIDQRGLAESLQKWAINDGIKICVSSRPHLEFMDTFSDTPSLRIRLHDLTKHDIYVFSRQMFEADRNFDRIGKYLQLVDRVVSMSEGVFLWARLAVRSLLVSIGRYDTDKDLEEKFNAIPKDLDELYDKLLSLLDPIDRRRCERILLLVALNPLRKPLNALAITWLDDLENSEFPLNSYNPEPYSAEEIDRRQQYVQRQISSLSKGLLEITLDEPHHGWDGRNGGNFYSQRVQFFHRTLADYLKSDERLRQLISQFPTLGRDETYLRLSLAEFVYSLPLDPPEALRSGPRREITSMMCRIFFCLQTHPDTCKDSRTLQPLCK